MTAALFMLRRARLLFAHQKRPACMTCKYPRPQGDIPCDGECSCYYEPPTRWFLPEAEAKLRGTGKLTGKGENGPR